jgi:hypothetical protein
MSDRRLLALLSVLAATIACNLPAISSGPDTTATLPFTKPAPTDAASGEADADLAEEPDTGQPSADWMEAVELECGSTLDDVPDGTLVEGETLACMIGGLPEDLDPNVIALEVTGSDGRRQCGGDVYDEWFKSGADVYDKWFDHPIPWRTPSPLPPGDAAVRLVYSPSGETLAETSLVVEPFSPPDTMSLLADLPRFEQPYPGVCMVVFDTTQPPFDDVRLRRLFSAAIDREQLVEEADCGCGHTQREPTMAINPPRAYDNTGTDPGETYTAWLESLSEDNPEDVLAAYEGDITLGVDAGGHEIIAQFIRANWKEYLAVDVELAVYPWEDIHDTIHGEDAPSAYLLCGYAEVASPFDLLYAQVIGYYGDYVLWEPPTEYYLTLLEALETDDPELYLAIERMLVVDYAAIAPVYHYTYQP